MNSLISAQIAAAQLDAEKVFTEDQRPIDLDSPKISVGRELEIKFSQHNDVVSADISSRRPVEGPKLGQVKQGGSPVHAPDGPQSWGKVSRG
jgi:hypothetical protein